MFSCLLCLLVYSGDSFVGWCIGFLNRILMSLGLGTTCGGLRLLGFVAIGWFVALSLGEFWLLMVGWFECVLTFVGVLIVILFMFSLRWLGAGVCDLWSLHEVFYFDVRDCCIVFIVLLLFIVCFDIDVIVCVYFRLRCRVYLIILVSLVS